MNTKPVDPDLLAYLMQERAANLPAVREQQAAPVVYPQSRMFPELAQPVAQTVVVQRGVDPKAQRMAGLGVLLLCAGGGVDLAGHGVEVAGTGLWAVAAIFISIAVARIFAPRHTAAARSTTIVLGSHNHINR